MRRAERPGRRSSYPCGRMSDRTPLRAPSSGSGFGRMCARRARCAPRGCRGRTIAERRRGARHRSRCARTCGRRPVRQRLAVATRLTASRHEPRRRACESSCAPLHDRSVRPTRPACRKAHQAIRLAVSTARGHVVSCRVSVLRPGEVESSRPLATSRVRRDRLARADRTAVQKIDDAKKVAPGTACSYVRRQQRPRRFSRHAAADPLRLPTHPPLENDP